MLGVGPGWHVSSPIRTAPMNTSLTHDQDQTPIVHDARLLDVITQLVSDAHFDQAERRSVGRVPFFSRVVLTLDGGQPNKPDAVQLSAFTRDVSAVGIGLVHAIRLNPQVLSLTTRLRSGAVANITVDLEWCDACGDGWYISGGSFLAGRVLNSPDT